MKKSNFINRNIERLAVKKAVESLEQELFSMKDLQEKNYLNVLNTGFLINTTGLKRRILSAGITLLKTRLKNT